jgi:NAD(P)-dependent dehydrogenase (short-subunit alcohol dehydrogenase family)
MRNALFDIEGATVLVTGGSRGIGFFLAQAFVEAGARVFISGRKEDDCDASAAQLSRLGSCVSVPCDLSKLESIEYLVAQLSAQAQRLNIIVNNAGATWGESIDTYPEKHWDEVIDVNLKAPFFLVQKCLPLLRKASNAYSPARVINIGSIAGLNPMGRDSFAYAASKAALHHMTRHMARHLAPEINVNAIAPGAFETRMISFALQDRAALEALIPSGRVGQADDIGGAALFLASRAGAYVTGAVLPVDGGMALRNA